MCSRKIQSRPLFKYYYIINIVYYIINGFVFMFIRFDKLFIDIFCKFVINLSSIFTANTAVEFITIWLRLSLSNLCNIAILDSSNSYEYALATFSGWKVNFVSPSRLANIFILYNSITRFYIDRIHYWPYQNNNIYYNFLYSLCCDFKPRYIE